MAELREPLSFVSTQVEAILDVEKSKNKKFLAACSGGPDSVGLVYALMELKQNCGLRFDIAHINHHLRGRDSMKDQIFVQKLGKKLGIQVHVASKPISKKSGNLEKMAREARYDALLSIAKQRGLSAILTAHTLDDQAETIFINMMRGAGLDGIIGMRKRRFDLNSGVEIVRPLLGVSRDALHRYVRTKGPFRTDKSNSNPRFFRNHIRLKLFHELHQRLPGFEQRLVSLGEIAREDVAVLDSLAEKALKRAGRKTPSGWVVDFRVLSRAPMAVQRRAIRLAAGRDLLTFAGLERLMQWMGSLPSNGRTWQLKKGRCVERLSRSGGSPIASAFLFRQPQLSVKRLRRLYHKRTKIRE